MRIGQREDAGSVLLRNHHDPIGISQKDISRPDGHTPTGDRHANSDRSPCRSSSVPRQLRHGNNRSETLSKAGTPDGPKRYLTPIGGRKQRNFQDSVLTDTPSTRGFDLPFFQLWERGYWAVGLFQPRIHSPGVLVQQMRDGFRQRS
jgi:hypothetical protein